MGIPEADAEPEGVSLILPSFFPLFPYSLIPYPLSPYFFLFVPLILLYLFIPLEKKSCLSLSSLRSWR